MEKARTRKIKKWDEVHGEHEVEITDETRGTEPASETSQVMQDDKKSVLEKLKEQGRQVLPQVPVPERKPVPGCCLEREHMGW